ncbi:MAG: copper homeostasis periplasmic binding protein CopC [Rhodocyclaceae bacterium]|nr:copper homeostasis periplasmic binding protein CopC [Rhodocyclaceae bacterium]
MKTINNAYLRNTIAGLCAMVSAAAFAHPKLVSSTPADQSTGAAPAKIELHFNEDLVTQFSGAKLTMTSMPGMDMPMKMPVKVSPGDDAKTMVLTPTSPLPAGGYRVDWRAVSSDTHPITGNFSFTVK